MIIFSSRTLAALRQIFDVTTRDWSVWIHLESWDTLQNLLLLYSANRLIVLHRRIFRVSSFVTKGAACQDYGRLGNTVMRFFAHRDKIKSSGFVRECSWHLIIYPISNPTLHIGKDLQ